MGPLIRARTTCPILPIFKPAPTSSIAGAMTQKRLDAFFTSTKPAKAAPTDQGTTDTSGNSGNNGNNGNKKQKTAVGPADPANAAAMRANANRNLALAKQAVIACEKTGSVPALADLLIDSSWKGALSEEVRSSAWARARNFSLTRSLVYSFARSLVRSFARSLVHAPTRSPDGQALLQGPRALCPVRVELEHGLPAQGLRVPGVQRRSPRPSEGRHPRTGTYAEVHLARCTPPPPSHPKKLSLQDPYHDIGQAQGLSFSVPKGKKIPSSLRNIYKEISEDIGCSMPKENGCLEPWCVVLLCWPALLPLARSLACLLAPRKSPRHPSHSLSLSLTLTSHPHPSTSTHRAHQGVLMLNSVLTVEAHKAASHSKRGWEDFTTQTVRIINKERSGVVFMLWGKYAQEKGSLIDTKRHHVLKSPHPSGLSAHRGFFGCKHFSQANDLLVSQGGQAIDWKIQ